ncbi:MAG: DUF3135 domain-containing protein [Proteobacteria bacterium]|nr:DUF3135 domain-containing protein [Pseudomonadota bacterium]NOG61485.1 DUF3135 domain-containing protein [Pseudomonadota bacterium]
MTSVNTEFDFDAWVKLAKENPEAYEEMRQKMIQDVIDNTSPEVKRRLQGLQWKIDQIRSTSTNPMSSCLKISQMMWDNVIGEDGLVDHMRQLNEPAHLVNLDKPKDSATVIDIRSSNTDSEKS